MDGGNKSWSDWVAAMARHVEGGESRQFGSVFAASVGAPMELFNQAFVVDDPVAADVEAATAWLRERGVPFWVTAPGHLHDSLSDLAPRLDLTVADDSMPGMVLSSLSDLSAEMPAHLELAPVTHPDQLETVAIATADGFGAPVEFTRHMAPASMIDDDSMQWFVGHVDGEPAACGQLLLTDEVAGVYTIAVCAPFRRRGLGEAMTRAVLLAGRDRGATYGILQSSDMGRSVYERMGFETFTHYTHLAGGRSGTPGQ